MELSLFIKNPIKWIKLYRQGRTIDTHYMFVVITEDIKDLIWVILHPIKTLNGESRPHNITKPCILYRPLSTLRCEEIFQEKKLNPSLYMLYDIQDKNGYEVLLGDQDSRISTILLNNKAVIFAGNIEKIHNNTFYTTIDTSISLNSKMASRLKMKYRYILTNKLKPTYILENTINMGFAFKKLKNKEIGTFLKLVILTPIKITAIILLYIIDILTNSTYTENFSNYTFSEIEYLYFNSGDCLLHKREV